MKKNGYHRILVPEEHGGDLVGPLEFNTFFEEIAWGGVGFCHRYRGGHAATYVRELSSVRRRSSTRWCARGWKTRETSTTAAGR